MHGWCGGECGCQQFVMSAVWAASELTQPQPTHIRTTYTPTSASTYDQEEVKSKERERDMFPSARQMVFVRQPYDVDLGESPFQSTHTHMYTLARTHARAHAHAHTHTNTHIHSHVNICGDSSRRQRSKSEPHLLLDLPHTHARIQLFYPGSKPNLA